MSNYPPNEWHPQPGKQTQALTYRVFEEFYGGARGGGKTEVGLGWLSIDIEHPRYRALVIRKNTDDLKNWLDRAKVLYQPLGADFIGQPAEIRFPWGASIRTGHLKDDNAYEKYQGQEFCRMLIEEIQQIKKEELYLKLISSCRSVIPELKPRIFATGNPGGRGHAWVKKRFVDVAPPMQTYKDPVTGRHRVFVPATVDDNPLLKKNDPGYIHFLEGLPDALKKAWRYGRWDIFAGQYFSEWDPSKHVIKPFSIPVTFKKFGGYDHGRAKPACFKWYAVDYDGSVICYRELYVNKEDGSPRWEAEQIAREVYSITERNNETLDYVVADSAIFSKTGHAETIAEIFQKNGVGRSGGCIPLLIPSHKDRIAGWAIMHQYLYHDAHMQPRLRYFETCYDSIRTLPEQIYDDNNPEDLDSDGEDHAADVDRYFLQTLKSKKSIMPMTEEQKAVIRFQEKIGVRKFGDDLKTSRWNI